MKNAEKTKVLIIDDNHSILDYLKTVLSRYNFNIKTAMNGYEGLQLVAEFKPDVVFLDLMMPNLDGLQLLQLKKVLIDIKDIPVIVISANAGRNNVMAAIEAGADRVLAKPINLKQLKTAVDELLGGNFFDLVLSEDEVLEMKKSDEALITFNEKFSEYRDLLIEALKNRDPETVKAIIGMLGEYSKELNDFQVEKLYELEKQDYSKPSDWILAEIKIKEFEQQMRKTINRV